MATQIFSRVFPKTLTSFFSRSLSTTTATPPSSSFLHRLRPFSVAAITSPRVLLPASYRALSTHATTSSLKDPNPNWSNRPPKETILLDGCDFEHWLVVMEPPEGDPTRDEIIDSYIKTLAQVLGGSEDEARMKIYSVSTRHYFAFGALVSEEMSYKIKELPKVRWVLPDSYLHVKEKNYGGEPFINGQAVPYDPKYHQLWVENNRTSNDRNMRNGAHRDRRRGFAVNRDTQSRPNPGAVPSNAGGYAPPPPGNRAGDAPPPPSHRGGYAPPNAGGYAPSNAGDGYPPSPSPSNMGGGPPNSGPMGGMPQNNYPGNMGGVPRNQNMGGFPPKAGWSSRNSM